MSTFRERRRKLVPLWRRERISWHWKRRARLNGLEEA
jgi:hypothetical protein